MPSRSWTPARHAHRKRSNANLKQRLMEQQPGSKLCWVADCGHASGRASGGSLGRFCEKHQVQYRRHGSPLRTSYKASESNPARRAALAWMRANPKADWAVIAVSRINSLYDAGGQPRAANSLRGVSNADKARAVWARLRVAGVDPVLVGAAIIGVTLVFEADPQKPSAAWGVEYRRVQIAKVLNRLAGGTVKRWAREPRLVDDGVPRLEVPPPTLLKAFPASAGRVLRLLGKQAEDACELILEYDLPDIQAFTATVPVTKASMKSPWPDRQRAKAKPRVPEEMKPTGSYAARENDKLAKRKAAERERKARRLASIVTPEQEAARQPSVRTLRDGVWVEV